MNPDYQNAATKAIETVIYYNVNPAYTDPFYILNKLRNVILLKHNCTDLPNATVGYADPSTIEDNQDAFTFVNKKNGNLQYIVFYNTKLSPEQFRFALARELGHVILGHDGSQPEYVWLEEANCFAYHFLCPLPLTHPVIREQQNSAPINYRPRRDSLLWEMKEIRTFDSIDDMKAFVADEYNRLNRYSGVTDTVFSTFDVELSGYQDQERITGWKNCYDIVLNGKTVGYCGE